MILYTCSDGKSMPAIHPCGKSAKALDDAGHHYEHKQVKGGLLKLWTWPARSRDRAEIERLSGQRAVPLLILDDGGVLTGSATIARWAKENSPAVAS
ncbi:MAG TPA: glutathione S-transferase N-terminal domain-containing protein [Solirubrobacteraceae bacterium]|jgi:glutathione S-transferase